MSNIPHGTLSGYSYHKCRCQECRVKWSIYHKARAEKRVEFLQDYKMVRGCIDCGYNEHHAALQFDHVRGEKGTKLRKGQQVKANVSYFRNHSMERLMEEIDKCDIRCANCHAIRSYGSGQIRRGSGNAIQV